MSLKYKNLIGFGCSLFVFLILLITFLYIGFGLDYSNPHANGGSISQSVYYKGWGNTSDIASASSLKYGDINTNKALCNSITALSILIIIISAMNCIYFATLTLTSLIGKEIDKPIIKRIGSLVIWGVMFMLVILFISAVAELRNANVNFNFNIKTIDNGHLSLAPITYISFIFIVLVSLGSAAPAALLV